MPTSSLSNLARRGSLVASRRLAPTLLKGFTARAFSAEKVQVPPEDYHDGHLMADHLEYLDDMLDKTVKIEKGMEDLKETYKKKQQIYSNVGFMEADEIDALFKKAGKQKEELSAHIAELKALVQESKKTFAVDAPDGYSDFEYKEGLEDVKHIIDDAAKLEDVEGIKDARKTYAVDAPDGYDDGETKAGMEEANHIIDDVAKNKDKINKQHVMEDAVKKERARDAEHDW